MKETERTEKTKDLSATSFYHQFKYIFFGVYRAKSTYRNLAFSLVLFFIGIITFSYVIFGIFGTIPLMIIGIGVLLNYLFILSLPKVIYYISLLSHKITGSPMKPDPPGVSNVGSETFIKRYLALVRNPKTIWYLLYLIMVFPITTFLFTITIGFITIALILRIDPFFQFITGMELNDDLNLSRFGFPNWVVTYEVFILSFTGFLIMTFQLHLVNRFVKVHSNLIERMSEL